MALKLPKARTVMLKAPYWRRIIAFIIDLLILDLVLGYPLERITRKLIPTTGFFETQQFISENSSVALAISLLFLFQGLLILLYFTILEYRLGQTIGKKVMNLFVVGEKGRGFLSYALRNLWFVFIFPFFLLFIIEPFFILFRKDNKRLLELFSKTKTMYQQRV